MPRLMRGLPLKYATRQRLVVLYLQVETSQQLSHATNALLARYDGADSNSENVGKDKRVSPGSRTPPRQRCELSPLAPQGARHVG